MADFGILQTFGMPFEYNVASYTLHLIGLYSVRYGKIVLTFSWSRKEDKVTYTVTNIKGNSKHEKLPSGYSSWIEYWEKKTGKRDVFCKAHNCFCYDTEGAHVRVAGHGDYWYIVPLCHMHNESPYMFTVEGPLVPVNPEIPILE